VNQSGAVARSTLLLLAVAIVLVGIGGFAVGRLTTLPIPTTPTKDTPTSASDQGLAQAEELKTLRAQVAELQQRIGALEKSANACREPHITLVPRAAPVGTRVAIVGDCFPRKDWDGGYGLFLIRAFDKPQACELIAAASPASLDVRKSGRAFGFLTVPQDGSCFQEDYGLPVTAGEYGVGIGCHACISNATFRVT
jgi:hypothetical protein